VDYSDFDVWDFRREDHGQWSWRRSSADGELRLKCRDTFSELRECVNDARRCGYTGSFGSEETQNEAV
jgi:hypothetical protein